MLYKAYFQFGVTRYIELNFASALDHFNAAFEHFTVALEKEMIAEQDITLPLLAWRGLSLAHVGRTTEAEADLSRLTELYPDEPFAKYAWACFYCLQGDNDQALIQLAKAIEGDVSFRKTALGDADFTALKIRSSLPITGILGPMFEPKTMRYLSSKLWRRSLIFALNFLSIICSSVYHRSTAFSLTFVKTTCVNRTNMLYRGV